METVRLPCGLCGEVVARQIRAHAVDLSLQHPCTLNRMRNVLTEYVRASDGWHAKSSPVSY